MDVGYLLRIERIKKGKTQKEFCHDIVTVSYYSKIERNLHSVTVEVLVELLEKNNIDINYFFQQISNEKSIHSVVSEISDYFYKNDTDGLQNLLKVTNVNPAYSKTDKKLLESLLQLLTSILSNDVQNLQAETKRVLQTQLFELLSWNYQKLSLYSQIIALYDIDSNLMMIKSILEKGIDAYSFQEKKFIMVILVNFVIICFKNNLSNVALKYCEIIEQESTNPENFFLKMINKFFYLLILKKNGEKVESGQLESILDVIKISGMEEYANHLSKLLN